MNKIYVLGMGPGSKDYILPITTQVINTCDVLIGGKRNLQHYKHLGKEYIYIKSDLEEVIHYVQVNRSKKKIAFLLSGDTGFYSMLQFLKKYFQDFELEVIPGISSIQYLAARIGECWHDAFVGSLHGRNLDLLDIIKKKKKLILLTDYKHSPKEIAKLMLDNKIDNKMMIVGENLSYENERIIFGKPEEIMKMSGFEMSVVVIKDAVDI